MFFISFCHTRACILTLFFLFKHSLPQNLFSRQFNLLYTLESNMYKSPISLYSIAPENISLAIQILILSEIKKWNLQGKEQTLLKKGGGRKKIKIKTTYKYCKSIFWWVEFFMTIFQKSQYYCFLKYAL